MLYQAWKDNSSITFSSPEVVQAQFDAGLIEKDAVMLHEIEADTWDEAMTEHFKLMGYEPYVPMKDEPVEVADIMKLPTLYSCPF